MKCISNLYLVIKIKENFNEKIIKLMNNERINLKINAQKANVECER